MQVVHSIADLRAALSGRREINFVPTMGNLHDGHLALVRAARQRDGVTVASIFVNPLQFLPHEDFATYPRTLERDCGLLANGGCHLVFAPDAREMYPEVQEYKVHPPPRLADILEGGSRPGFFVGVCTVVLKLFGIVQPSAALFGKKDYQQLLVLSHMVRQLALPIEVIAVETVRDRNGLALSSRNGYLSEVERTEAAQLHGTLRRVVSDVTSGRSDWLTAERDAGQYLRRRGWRPDYVAVRRQGDLSAPTAGEPWVVLAAARLGGTRLIDNLEHPPLAS